MNLNGLNKQYDSLTPRERFRLILAASGRGDDLERNRLVKAGGRISCSFQDHAPYAYAFDELGRAMYLELLEAAHVYTDSFSRDIEQSRNRLESDEPVADDDANSEDGEESDDVESLSERRLAESLALGFMLRVKADGWRQFCEELHVPPFALWQELPGFPRLEHALSLADRAAFSPEGFLRWLNEARPADRPPHVVVPISAEEVAAATAAAYQRLVKWWSPDAK